MTPNERLASVLRFLNLDLDDAREGDVLNARDDVLAILQPIGEEQPGMTTTMYGDFGSDDLPLEELVELQRRARTLFRDYVKRRDALRRGRSAPPLVPIWTKVGWVFDAPESGDKAIIVVRADDVKDAFLAILVHLVATKDTGDVRACPVCDKLFVRTRRKEYDSPACQNIASTRAFRERERLRSLRKK